MIHRTVIIKAKNNIFHSSFNKLLSHVDDKSKKSLVIADIIFCLDFFSKLLCPNFRSDAARIGGGTEYYRKWFYSPSLVINVVN